jgi:hypothetical protein
MGRKSRRKKTNYEDFIQGLQRPTNKPRLIRLIQLHPAIAAHLQQWNQDVIEGEYCKLTEEAVRNFQREKGIRVDGLVNSTTWKRMGYSKRKLRRHGLDYNVQRSGGLRRGGGLVVDEHDGSLEGPPGVHNPFPKAKHERTGSLEGLPEVHNPITDFHPKTFH